MEHAEQTASHAAPETKFMVRKSHTRTHSLSFGCSHRKGTSDILKIFFVLYPAFQGDNTETYTLED